MDFLKNNKGKIILLLLWLSFSLSALKPSMMGDTMSNGQPMTEEQATFMALLLGGFVISFFVAIGWVIKNIIKRPLDAAKKRKDLGITLEKNLIHFDGLPIAENTICKILSYADKYEFVANGLSFNLQKDRITDICIKTDVEIQKQAVSSIGGAVAGAVLLGPLGAIIGGRAKDRKVKTTTKYLIITYLKDEEVKILCFVINPQIDPWSELNSMAVLNEYKSAKLKGLIETGKIETKQIDL